MRVPGDYVKRFMAGATFGLYMAHLLYFLNPQIEITPGRILRASLFYALTCGLSFGSILWLLHRARLRLFYRPDVQARRHGFGWIVTATFVSAAIFFLHALVLRIYLPIGAVRILTKATNLIAFVAFLLLFFWAAERNSPSKISRLITALGLALIAASCVILFLRRDRYRGERQGFVTANLATVAGQRPLFVVAIEGLPYDWLVTLSGEGRFRFLDRAMDRGFFTRLEPFPATSPKALWASLVTGKLPHRHGVTGRFAYQSPLGGAGSDERFLLLPQWVGFKVWGLLPTVKRISPQLPSGDSIPFWSAFGRVGIETNVIGWPSTTITRYPASVMITERFLKQGARLDQVRPDSFFGIATRLLVSPTQIDMKRFEEVDRRVAEKLARALADDASAMSIARSRLQKSPGALTVVSLGGLSDGQEALGIDRNDLPPTRERAGSAIRAFIERVDLLLEAAERDFPELTLVVVSLSGPEPPRIFERPAALARKLIGDQNAGTDDGFILMQGPGVRSRPNPQAARAVDFVPTMLFLAGLPIARDMDGRVMTEAFDDSFLATNPLSLIQTYEARKLLVRRERTK